MKNIVLALVLFSGIAGRVHAQELIFDNLDNNKFIGTFRAGDMGEFLYVPYFSKNTDNKKNFSVKKIDINVITEQQVAQLELPETYRLKNAGFSDMNTLLIFYDEAKKEDVMMTVANNTVTAKKTLKAKQKVYLSFGVPEAFIVVTVGNKGAYTIEKTDPELKQKWEKSFSPPSGATWDILSVKSNMEGLEIIRREKSSDGKYSFSFHAIQREEGLDIAQNKIETEQITPYPTFFTYRDGMYVTGGYYFKDGKYSARPDGIFIGTMGPAGTLNEVATVPFSQVVEALKSTVGNKLADENNYIIFSGGAMSHETQSYVMTGQLISKKKTENGSKVTLGDFVTVSVGVDGKFKNASLIKVDNPEILTLKGDLSKVSTLELGYWLNSADLLHFRYYNPMPGNPVMGYISVKGNGMADLCFRNVGIENDTLAPICMPVHREATEATTTYTFTGTETPVRSLTQHPVITPGPIPTTYVTTDIVNNIFTIRKMPILPLDELHIELHPEEPDHTEEPVEEEPVEEEVTPEG